MTPEHEQATHLSDRSHSLRGLRISSRSLVADDSARSQHSYRSHPLHLHDMDLLKPEGHHDDGGGVVQLQRGDQALSIAKLTLQSLSMGAARLQRAVVRGGRNVVPKSSAVGDISKRVTNSVSSSTSFYRTNLVVLYREVLCGIAATLLMIPETVAFSYVANLDPIVGLYATGFFGLIVGVFGGVPATVAGAAGALAVAMPPLTSATGSLAHLSYEQRIQHLFVAVFIAGLLQLLFGVFELSRFFSMIPRTAHIGFLNGLALMMLLSQKTTFEVCTRDDLRFGECEKQGHLTWMSVSDATTYTTIFTVVLTVLVMHFFPRVPRVGRIIPPTLVVAVVGIGFEFGINRPLLGYDVRTIGDTSPLSGSLPSFHFPLFSAVDNWGAVLSCAASLAMIGIFESIMTIQAVVDLTKHQLSREGCRRECVAQGLGNIVCGLFSAMGGCSMIGQSTGNVLNGARHRLSSVVMGVVIFMIILFGSPLIELVPVACLTGILLVIIAHTFYWPSLQLVFRMKISDAFAVVLVTTLATVVNLAVAVIAGVVWESLVNGWSSGQQLSAHTSMEIIDVVQPETESEGGSSYSVEVKVYHVRGTLLYSSVVAFRALFDFEHDPQAVIVDLRDCHFADFSAVAALKEIALRFQEHGKTLAARHLDPRELDLVLHRDIGWQCVDQVVVLKPDSEVHPAESPIRGFQGMLTPRSPSVSAPYDALDK